MGVDAKKIYFNSKSEPKSYLIVIFSGINTSPNNPKMNAFASELTNQLTFENSNNKVDTLQITSFSNENRDEIFEGIFDSIQVFYRSFYKTTAIQNFQREILNKYKSNNYDLVIFVGYSGGGVMATRVADAFINSGENLNVKKIIRIGSPTITLGSNENYKKTYDLVVPGDLIQNISIENKFGIKSYTNVILDLVKEKSIVELPIDIKNHFLYFDNNKDENGISNLEKTTKYIIDIIC